MTGPQPPASRDHAATRETCHGWSKALMLPPDLYPGVGGKQFRAELVRGCFEAAGGTGDAPEAVIDAIEMLHAGSLVVDDFEDGSAMRRGQPSLHRVVGAPRAVNAGNWMYFRALELAAAAYEAPRPRAELLERFVTVGRICHEGQALDLTARADRVTASEAASTAYLISKWKTGSLVSLAAWGGVHAACGSDTALRFASTCGETLGVCLQMRNDLDELIEFADGSDRGDDLANARVTWPWAWAAGLLSPSLFRGLQRSLRSAGGDRSRLRKVACGLRDLVVETGTRRLEERLSRLASRLREVAGPECRVERLLSVAERLRPEPVAAAVGVGE